jgi:hypothetical protein
MIEKRISYGYSTVSYREIKYKERPPGIVAHDLPPWNPQAPRNPISLSLRGYL